MLVMYCSMNHACVLRFLSSARLRDTVSGWGHDVTVKHDWALPLATVHNTIKNLSQTGFISPIGGLTAVSYHTWSVC